MKTMLDLKTNRYSSEYRTNGRGDYKGIEYELQNMGLLWRIRSKVGQFFGETSSEVMMKFKQVADSTKGL